MAKTLTVFLAADTTRMNRGLKDAQGGLSGLTNSLKNMLGPALIAAGAAAGAFAVKLAVDGVKAAMDDQVALEKLTQTLENLGLAHNIGPIEEYVRGLERSLGVADTELRPAYDRLIRSTGNVAQANRALKIALDVSAGSGKSLDAVVQALGRAFDGNTQGLSRLGAGLDTALLKTGNMDLITNKLAETFGGQATRQSQTFEGQTKRLQQAVDNLGEAFGTGLLNALGDTNDKTQDFVDTMGDLEPLLDAAGREVGNSANQLVGFGTVLLGVTRVVGDFLKDMGTAGTLMQRFGKIAMDALNPLAGLLNSVLAIGRATGLLNGNQTDLNATNDQAAARYQALADSLNNAAAAQMTYNQSTGTGYLSQKRLNDINDVAAARYQLLYETHFEVTYAANETAKANDRVTKATGGAARATQGLTDAQQKNLDQYNQKQEAVRGLLGVLDMQRDKLAEAKTAFNDYAASIGQAVTSGVDLGKAFQAQFDKDGKLTGVSFLDALNKQIGDARAFGNVLQNLEASGAKQNLIDQIATLGPDVGGELGQQLIDDGLVPTVQAKADEVAQLAADTGLIMSTKFNQAGIDAANNLIDGTIKTVREERKKLSKLGEGMGKLIGGGIKKEIAQAVAEAVREAEASRAAARAEAVAAAVARQQAITDQAVGQALARLISNSDARTARGANPVLT